MYEPFLWKIKKSITITNGFQKILKESNRHEAKTKGRKPSKIWVDKDREFYNRSIKSWLERNNIVMYSTHNEGKSVVTERTLRTKIYKYMTSISKNVYIDQLDNIVNQYNKLIIEQLKWKLLMLNQEHILTLVKK